MRVEPANKTSTIGWVSAASFAAMMLVYGSKGPQFYLTWATGIGVVTVAVVLLLCSGQLSRSSLKIALICSGWAIYAAIVTPFATDVQRHLQQITLHTFYLVVVVAIIGVCVSSPRLLVRAIAICTFAWILVNLSLLIMYVVGLIDYPNDFSGAYYNRNTLAVSGAVLMSFWMLLEDRFRAEYGRITVASVVTFLVVLVLASLSTKGLLAVFVLGLCKIIFSGSPRVIVRFVTIATVLTASVLVAGGPIVNRTVEKIEALTKLDSENKLVGNSGLERAALILASARVIVEHPITGVGVDNGRYHLFTPRFFIRLARGDVQDVTEGSYSHNNYTEMLLNAGIPGFLLYYCPLLWLFVRTKRLEVPTHLRDLRQFVMGAVVLKLVMDSGMVSYNDLSHLSIIVTAWLIHFRYLGQPNLAGSLHHEAAVSRSALV